MLRLNQVSKSFEGNAALSAVSLEIADGEFVVLVGPSGCGKSTLLRLIAGLESVSSGEIWLDNQQITTLSPRDRNFAMIFQNYALFPHLSVRDNITFGMKVRNEERASWQPRLERVAQMLELDTLLERKPAKLSGGQRQRVLIAMALSRSPKLVVCDEPTTALDVTVQKQVVDLLNELREQLGFAMVFVSHDLALVASLAHRVTVMYAGQVVESGPISEVLSDPHHEYTQGLLGAVLSIESKAQRLHQIPGTVPSPYDFAAGDRFAERSQRAGADPDQHLSFVPVDAGSEHRWASHQGNGSHLQGASK